MKKAILLISVIVFSVVSTFAQITASKEEAKAIQEAFGKERRIIVASLIDLDGADSVKFWGIYDSFESVRIANAHKRFLLYKKYQSEYETLDDKDISELVKDMMNIVSIDNKRILKHHNQIKKALGSKVSGQYYQIEMYLQATVRLFYLNEIEFIGEDH